MLDAFLNTPSTIEFGIMAIATWRVAFFLVYEGGPANIVQHIREWLGIDHSPDGTPLPYLGGGLGSLFSCVWCMSFWQAIMIVAVWVYAPYVVIGLALWGMAAVVETILGRLNR